MDTGFGTDTVILHDRARRQWLLFTNPIDIVKALTPESVVAALREVEARVSAEGCHAAGFVAYEAAPAFDRAFACRPADGFPLLWFGLYRAPGTLRFPAMEEACARSIPWQVTVSEHDYSSAVSRIKDYIRSGDTYQVNYTVRMRAASPGDPWTLFLQMVRAQGPGHAAFLDTADWAVCSASPELFFRLENGELVCRPMKGTAARGLQLSDDVCQAEWLRHSEKNRAENVMIVDMVRSDMGRVADAGSVRVPSLFEVEKYPTLWQMTSTVRCTTPAAVADVFGALFPAASITGAPKIRSMQIIRELEDTPRHVYTGAVGIIAPGRRAQFNVAIRTVLVDKRGGAAEYGVGGGIVWDSEADAEREECRTKAAVLTRPPPAFQLLETMLWTSQAGYDLLDLHLSRLAASADYFSRSIDPRRIRSQLDRLAMTLPPQPHRIRLLMPEEGEPILEAQPCAAHNGPYRIRIARDPVDSGNRFLYHKTTHRRVYEKAIADAPDCDDVLLWNERGEVTESCIANVAVELDGVLVTPPVCCGLLPGIQRFTRLARGEIRERVVTLDDLKRCSRIVLMNAVRGMWDATLEEQSGRRGDDIEHDGEEVADARGEYEQVPQGVVVGQALPGVEDHAGGVEQAAAQEP
ncbi:MAG: aminodeoxychorismate synthase component I [Kiritimatiellae bacterium]|nr:aminodeoxychorismate synthase component I [Kiritimatiellia bacterium]